MRWLEKRLIGILGFPIPTMLIYYPTFSMYPNGHLSKTVVSSLRISLMKSGWLPMWYISSLVRSVNSFLFRMMSTWTVFPKKYAHGFVVLCFVVVMQLFIMNSHEVLIHIHQGCFAGTGAIVRLPQCQWNKPDGYGKISQWITTIKHSKAKPCAYFLGYTVCKLTDNQAHHICHYIPMSLN